MDDDVPKECWNSICCRQKSTLESFQDFFDQVECEITYASKGNKHFFTKKCHRQTYQNYEKPPRTSQNSDNQSLFLRWKIDQIIQQNISLKSIGLGDQL